MTTEPQEANENVRNYFAVLEVLQECINSLHQGAGNCSEVRFLSPTPLEGVVPLPSWGVPCFVRSCEPEGDRYAVVAAVRTNHMFRFATGIVADVVDVICQGIYEEQVAAGGEVLPIPPDRLAVTA